jgi:hypothetical protein
MRLDTRKVQILRGVGVSPAGFRGLRVNLNPPARRRRHERRFLHSNPIEGESRPNRPVIRRIAT